MNYHMRHKTCFFLHSFFFTYSSTLYKVLTTYPAPNSNSVFVDEAHLDEFPNNTKKVSQLMVINLKACELHKGLLITVAISDAEWHFLCVCLCTHEIIQPQKQVWSSFMELFCETESLKLFVWVGVALTCLNCSSLSLPGCCYLIFHLIGSQTFVDCMH